MKIILSPAKKMKKDDDLGFYDFNIYVDSANNIQSIRETVEFARKIKKLNKRIIVSDRPADTGCGIRLRPRREGR